MASRPPQAPPDTDRPADRERRAHTGRRRNEDARRAVLDAALALPRRGGADALSIDAIAKEARVSRQTVYRWWPSLAAILLEATSEMAEMNVPVPDTGSLRGDVTAFLRATYTSAGDAAVAPVLQALVRWSLSDKALAGVVADFAARRREVLRTILRRHGAPPGLDALLVELGYGLLWYRLLISGEPLDDELADHMSDVIEKMMGSHGFTGTASSLAPRG